MADLKKKFIDILFEDEEESEVLDLIEEEEKKNTKSVEKKESTILAKDILYRKPGTSAFINLDETSIKLSNDEPKVEDVYEMSSQISPIFGIIKENKPKSLNIDQGVIDTQTNKPVDSHLDIITSPIYGYGNKEDAMKNNYDVKGIDSENEEVELHQLFDDEDSVNETLQEITTNVNNIKDEQEDSDEISLFRLFGENK